MSFSEYLRKFVNDQLAAADEDIFGVFQQKIVEYEEVIDRQRELLDLKLNKSGKVVVTILTRLTESFY